MLTAYLNAYMLVLLSKITTFLKKYSLIDNQFIDNFYSFYDEGKMNMILL
jgi:hypothetical protein